MKLVTATLFTCGTLAVSATAQAAGSTTPATQAIPAISRTTPAISAALTPAEMAPRAATSATIVPSLTPDRLGAKAALTVAIHYAGGEAGVPAPVRRSVMRFPAGLTLDIPHLRSCAAARLLARGPSGCPARSALGRGEALAEAREGAILVKEHITLWAFLGTPRDGWATVEILGEGFTPQRRRMVVTGTMSADRAPFGEQLTIPFPPIPTLPGAGDASLRSFSLTIGTSAVHHRGAGSANAVVVPSSCPVGGLPFGAEFTYADGSHGGAEAAVPCRSKIGSSAVRGGDGAGAGRVVAPLALAPQAAAARARAARTVSLTETGHLHLVGKPHGFTLNEQGTASGTAKGAIYVHLTIVSTSRVTAEVSIYPRGGSITGYATASYRTSSSTASFNGSMSVVRGTGSYAHAHGTGLRFSGTIERSNDAVTVYVSGRLSD